MIIAPDGSVQQILGAVDADLLDNLLGRVVG